MEKAGEGQGEGKRNREIGEKKNKREKAIFHLLLYSPGTYNLKTRPG